MDNALSDIGAILWIAGLLFCIKFLYCVIKSDREKMSANFYLAIFLGIAGLICRYYIYAATITMGIAVLCMVVIGLLVVLTTAAGLFMLIRFIISKIRDMVKRREHKIHIQRPVVAETSKKRVAFRTKAMKIKIHRNRQGHITDDIPDDSFFEIPLPPDGLE